MANKLSNEDILQQLRNGTAKFELVSSLVPSVVALPNRNTSLFGIGNCSTLFFARIGSSFGGQSPAMKKLERFSVQKVTGDGRCLFRALVKGMAYNKGIALNQREERENTGESEVQNSPGLFAYSILQNIMSFLQTQSVVLPLVVLSAVLVLVHIGLAYGLYRVDRSEFYRCTNCSFYFIVDINDVVGLLCYVCKEVQADMGRIFNAFITLRVHKHETSSALCSNGMLP
ncbi:uncharacterized protein LOC133304347 isoform X2 [Gastrolobium bilobum]|uniref:uncharacterized protein LOC133304347 isoform X2 n=1 Tax=Gastrolobium bilobum TaxID=150636 RepID=UPI002AB20937|nr:uncharacterized protein LOC133304347 isoform X2 [Gastrolobium bilobum]